MNRRALAFAIAGIVGLSALPAHSQQQSGNAMIVLDASGSMWGQVDGVPKIQIAREVFADLMMDWNPAIELGVIAYGHRREGDCSDIELIREVGPVDPATISSQVNALMPRGRTPLSDAVRQGAEALRYQDEPATVILLSDGIETCNADPCALAAELEAAGVNFTAHVIGFDVAEEDRPQLACIAEETGGLFLPADTAEQLSDALTTVAQATAEPEPAPEPLAFISVLASTGQPIGGVNWTIESLTTEFETSIVAGGPSVSPDLPPDLYQVTADHELNRAVRELDLKDPVGGEYVFELVDIATTLVPVDASTGAPVTGVNWLILNTETEASQTAVSGGEQYRVILEGGVYRVAAESAGLEGSATVDVAAAGGQTFEIEMAEALPEATVTAPTEIPAGSNFRAEWTGPDDNNDYITIVPVGADEDVYLDYARTRNGSPAALTAPDALGAHEVRYVHAETRRVLASQPVTLTPVSATVAAPAEIAAGANFEVDWTGPDNDNDYITIVPAGAPEGEFLDYARTRNGSPASITAPDALGRYEVRYVIAQSGRTLASQPVTLIPVDASVSAPAEIPAGANFAVAWTGPDNDNDYITIVPAGAPEGEFLDYARTRNGSPASITAPDALGRYEVRYVIAQSGRTLASQPVTLIPVDASVSGPDQATGGTVIRVEWTGPNNDNDYITVVEAGSPEGSYNDYARTRTGSPVEILLPDGSGAYEIRYVIAQSDRTLATQPITLIEATAFLDVPETVLPGADFEVAWEGPAHPQDFITIVEVGAAEGASGDYARIRSGNPVTITAPDQEGEYEVRYVLDVSDRTLAAVAVTVGIGDGVTLDGPATASPNGTIEVTWSGPGRYEDMIEIVPAGAAPTDPALREARATQGNPALLFAPPQAGAYEIRYRMSDTGEVLASVPLTVQ